VYNPKPKAWKIEGLRDTDFFCEKFYNSAEIKIPKNIQGEIHEIKYVDIKTSNNRTINSSLEGELRNKGWGKGENLGNFKNTIPDFIKDHIAIEAQFRQETNLLYNILSLQHAFNEGKITAGIIITFDARQHKIKHGMNASIQILDIFFREFEKEINFSVPLWVIGLKDHN